MITRLRLEQLLKENKLQQAYYYSIAVNYIWLPTVLLARTGNIQQAIETCFRDEKFILMISILILQS